MPGGIGLIGSSHKLVVGSLGPRNTMFLLHVTMHSVAKNFASQPLSTSVAMDVSEWFLRPGSTCPCRAAHGDVGSGSAHVCVDCIF